MFLSQPREALVLDLPLVLVQGLTNYESLNYPIYNVLRKTDRPVGKPKQRKQFPKYPD